MQDYEKLGVFYLGRHYDLEHRQTRSELLLYESRHLVTHGLVVGMTGSGKTGLCFDIIEEAAIDGIPSIVIDPKGDLGNLLLTFPDMRAEDFAPWLNEDEARRKGLAISEFAAQQADLWRQGLANWGQSGERIRRLRAAAEFALYTPGSSAGLPVSILSSFAAPPPEILEDGELLRDRVSSTIKALLGMVGIEADPVKSRESILLATILQDAWAKGKDLDIAGLIHEIQNPTMQRIGVLDLESFYPAADRFALALQLNNLVASPSFAAWTQGEPLDVSRFLYSAEGKPRVAIFSIAHLGESERMFFVTLLLNQVLSWMRTQSGTTSLRALVYMDEIFGYFPPVANPPSKQPLLTLLKQARAFGIGVVLATQNPVDLDYKGLANIGTWLIGRLQTERDKARILEGLEGAAASQGSGFDRAAAEQVLSGLGSRVFLLHDVHEEGPAVFESRWALSYLRGPLSREQIKTLTARPKLPPVPERVATTTPGAATAPAPSPSLAATLRSRPVLPPQVPQFFVPLRASLRPGGTVVYQPRLLGWAQIRYADRPLGIELLDDVVALTQITDHALPVDWTKSQELSISSNNLQREPIEAEYASCAPAAAQAKNYAVWERDFVDWLQSSRKLVLLRSRALNQFSKPGEPEREFRIRLQQVSRELRDEATAKLRARYEPKIATLQERLRRAKAAREREAGQAARAKVNTMISFGSTLLGAFLGRKVVSAGNLGRAASAMRSAGRAMDQAGDVNRAQDTVESIDQQLRDLETQFQDEVGALTNATDPAQAPLETAELRPARSGINVRLVALVWLPFTRNGDGQIEPAF